MGTVIKDYDAEMERLTELVNKEMEIYNAEKEKLDAMQENYRKIKHAKEVNKKLEDDWALKRQQFEIEENRKGDAAKFIFKMYEAWKEEEKKEEAWWYERIKKYFNYNILNIFLDNQ